MNSAEPVYTREAVMKMLKTIKRGNIDPEVLQRQLAMERVSSEDPSNLSGNSDLEDNEDLDDSLLMSWSTQYLVLISNTYYRLQNPRRPLCRRQLPSHLFLNNVKRDLNSAIRRIFRPNIVVFAQS